jgi:hypothetical protein
MSIRRQYVLAVALGLGVVLPLAWFDPVYIPLVLAGPPASGAFAAAHGYARTPLVVLWVCAGAGMLVSDWLINHEDRVYHVVLTVIMSLLALAGHTVVRALARRREGAGV